MNIYCFSTLSFAKLQFKSVINKAFHKHGVASFTDAWIETNGRNKRPVNDKSHLLQMRGLKPISQSVSGYLDVASFTDAWIETGTLPLQLNKKLVVPYIGTWIETLNRTARKQLG